MTALGVVVHGAAITQRHTNQRAFRLFGCLADCLRHFLCLALAEADAAALIAHDHEGRETKALTAFYRLRNTVDRHETIGEFRGFFAFATILATTFPAIFTFCHIVSPQNFRPPSRAASAKALILP